MSQQAEHRIGSVIGGKWRVDGLLGSGSMAAVYAVTHRNGARAALKILHPTLCADPAVCERFLGEGYLTNSVKHPGIVRVLDDGVTDDGCVFLVMDLLEGMTLETLRQERGGQIDLYEVLDIADKLMDVLHAVHEGGIIHRDLKPQNVFVCDDGSVKLLDFGVARVLESGAHSGAHSKLSIFGLVLGTPSFMSPEQALGARDKVDHRTDIWSLGATLFTALTGQTVHLGPNPQARLLAAAKMNARSIAMVKQDLPPVVSAGIDMALRFKKEDRWQSVDAFRRSLRDAREQLGWAVPEPEPAAASWLMSQESPALAAQPAPRDQGERALALMVRANHEAHGNVNVNAPPLLRPPTPDAPVLSSATQLGGFAAPGAGARFQGTTQRLHRMDRPQSDSGETSASRPSYTPQASPVRAPMPSLPEGSYPAASSTLEPAGWSRRRSRIGIWVVAVALVAVAASGIAFFAVKRANAGGGVPGSTGPGAGIAENATPVPPALTNATPPAAPSHAALAEAAAAASSEPTEPPPPAAAKGDAPGAAASSVASAPAPPSPRTPRAGAQAPAGAHPLPRATARPAPTGTDPPVPVLPPDPFGTPD